MPATQVKRRRGTTAQNNAFTGAEGEITVDLENKELRVHTGDNKVGGYGLARKDFENITDDAKNIANWSSNVSNCITEIPQDIKLELADGVLTLKAGSKVYVPNGFESDGTTPKFDIITIENDIQRLSADDNTLFLSLNTTDNSIIVTALKKGISGQSISPIAYGLVYNTSTNKITKYNEAKQPLYNTSFPFAIITSNTTQITSIDQVFNGFGYIGSTAFALPGVKGLMPNGRNADGSLNNTEITVSSVIIETTNSASITLDFVVRQNGMSGGITTLYWNYNEAKNQIYNTIGGKVQWIPCARFFVDSNGKITSFTPKTAFHAVDYSDTEFIAHQAMPGDKYINLTLGASGSTYTAPADGYIILLKRGNYQQYITIDSGYDKVYADYAYDNQVICLRISVKKGRNFSVWYSASQETQKFAFMYAQGAQ